MGIEVQPDVLERIYNLSKLEPGWNGYGVPAVNPISMQCAALWALEARKVCAETAYPWKEPTFVCGDEAGDVAFEWFGVSPRKLTVYVEASGAVMALKSWGANIWHEMEDIDFDMEVLGTWQIEWREVWDWLWTPST